MTLRDLLHKNAIPRASARLSKRQMRTHHFLFISLLTLSILLPGSDFVSANEDSNPPGDSIESELGIFVYPKGEQDSETQAKDSLSCYVSAKKKTGIDPRAAAEAAAAPPTRRGGAVRGAAGGALRGVALGAILDDAGRGAALGGASGAMRGRHAQKRARANDRKRAAEAASKAAAEKQSTFNRAFAACMDARNYSVK